MGTENHKNILSIPQLDVPKLKGLGSTYFYKMLENKDEIAVTCGMTGHNETYEQLLQGCIRAAITMRRKGIKPNDVITICSHNYPNYLIPYCASLFLGAVSANIDIGLPMSDIVHMFKQIHPKMVFADDTSVKLMKLSLRESGIEAPLVIFGDSGIDIPFRNFLTPSPEEKDFVPFEVNNLKDTAAIVFSSGTTGLPKGVCLTHYGLLGHMYHSISSVVSDVPRGFVVLVFSNFGWMSSVSITLFAVVNGCNQVLFPQFDVDFVWNLIQDYKPNLMLLAPCQIIEMCKNGRPDSADTSSLQFVLLTGDPMHKEQIRHVRKCLPGTFVINCYDQTEQNGSVITFRPATVPNDRKLMEEKPDSVGRPVAGFTYKIVDPDTEEILGPNQEGELRIISEFAMTGYQNMDSSHVWDSHGFMKTGDIVYYDDDHCFFVVDRIQDLIQYQTWHLSPSKLEAIFYTNGAVRACVVIGMPHPEDGNHLMGVVVLKEEAVGKVTAEDIQKYVHERVDEEQKLRAGVRIVENIPYTVMGKLSRRKIKQLVLEGKI